MKLMTTILKEGDCMSAENMSIEIRKNYIHYCDESLKISNISRISILHFFNKEKMEAVHIIEQKKKGLIFVTLGAIFAFLLSLIWFFDGSITGLFFLLIAAVCGFFCYQIVQEIAKLKSKEFPNKYGLKIEMNSGYSAIFTAIGQEGEKTLQLIQKKIEDADTQQGTIINLSENHITVENNNGNISTGDNTKNTILDKILTKK